MDFGTDELDQFFPDEAVEEFVAGITVDFGETDQQFLAKLSKAKDAGKEEREVFAAILIENDEMMKSAIFGVASEDFSIEKTRDIHETVECLATSSLAGSLITDDKDVMKAFIEDRFEHFEGKFTQDQILTVTKSLMNHFAL